MKTMLRIISIAAKTISTVTMLYVLISKPIFLDLMFDDLIFIFLIGVLAETLLEIDGLRLGDL